MKSSMQVVYIISYEEWGKMLMSKHHYAIELSRQGFEVFFINHPDRRYRLKRGEIKVERTDYANLYSVHHRSFIPYFFKLKFRRLYYLLVKYQIRGLVKHIGKRPDIIWSFDAGNTLPSRFFNKKGFKIYMPVDGPFNHIYELDGAEKANIVVSVTERILSRYHQVNCKKLLVNHGVNEVFINNTTGEAPNGRVHVGYSGSLVRNDLDIGIFRKIILAHPEVNFEFWGENDPSKSTIHLPQDVNTDTISFLQFLKQSPNVVMHGAVSPEVLAGGLKGMDLLIIAYNIKNDQNHHKVLEYLGTGKAIVSSYMSSYAGRPDLINMVKSSEDNGELPGLFDEVLANLNIHNAPDKQKHRMEYAREYSYANQVKRILKEANISL